MRRHPQGEQPMKKYLHDKYVAAKVAIKVERIILRKKFD
jgi:hypothetical protein